MIPHRHRSARIPACFWQMAVLAPGSLELAERMVQWANNEMAEVRRGFGFD